ncbi:unnamed protein product [Brachionus calyciflorus]|uniref:Peptidase S1 domain-containing protein n=1 Tax=Brachionus calyciflorus TaxID=104777 RepID=A0A814EX58_9BILA|nr:unnamed protein product [Brachionus calyciflorus]
MCNSQDSEYYCAFNKDSSVCNGDSGGGLFYQMNNQWYVYGIASFTDFDENGLGCPLKRPQYHTMVPNYLLWIKKAMEHAFSPYDKYSYFNYV